MNGTVKWYDKVRGYGFVVGSDGLDYFFHHSFIPKGVVLAEKDSIVFVPDQNDNGLFANKIRKVKAHG